MTLTLEQNLQQLGFTKNEIIVFLQIQKHGQITPTELSAVTGVNRTTIYSVAKTLVQRGLITEEHRGSKRFFFASPSDALGGVVRKEQVELNKRKELVNAAMNQLKAIEGVETVLLPKIQYILGENIEDFLYKRATIWNDSMLTTNTTFLGYQEESFAKEYQTWIDWYWKEAPEQIELFLLSGISEAEVSVAKRGYERRHVLPWKGEAPFASTLWVMGDYVVLFSLSSEPKRLVEIRDKAFAESQRALFQQLIKEAE